MGLLIIYAVVLAAVWCAHRKRQAGHVVPPVSTQDAIGWLLLGLGASLVALAVLVALA